MRRKLGMALAVIAAAWCLWWWAASTLIESGTRGMLETLRALGWQAEATVDGSGGFPLRAETDLRDLALVPPEGEAMIRTAAATVSAPLHRPGTLRIDTPETVLTLPAPFQTVSARESRADIVLAPRPRLPLDRAAGTWAGITATSPFGPLFTLETVEGTLTAADAPGTYAFEITATDLRPDPALRAALALPPSLPDSFAPLLLSGMVQLSDPIDRLMPPQARPLSVTVERGQIQWGSIALTARAGLEVDAEGRLSGPVEVTLAGWRDLLALLERSGALAPDRRRQLDAVLGAAAQGRDDLRVTLTLDRGRVSLGFIPLGRVPPIPLR